MYPPQSCLGEWRIRIPWNAMVGNPTVLMKHTYDINFSVPKPLYQFKSSTASRFGSHIPSSYLRFSPPSYKEPSRFRVYVCRHRVAAVKRLYMYLHLCYQPRSQAQNTAYCPGVHSRSCSSTKLYRLGVPSFCSGRAAKYCKHQLQINRGKSAHRQSVSDQQTG